MFQTLYLTLGQKASSPTFGNSVTVFGPNEVKHGVTSIEQAQLRRACVVALVTDRYKHRPHLNHKYCWLYKKSLPTLLLQRAVFQWKHGRLVLMIPPRVDKQNLV